VATTQGEATVLVVDTIQGVGTTLVVEVVVTIKVVVITLREDITKVGDTILVDTVNSNKVMVVAIRTAASVVLTRVDVVLGKAATEEEATGPIR